MEITTIIFQIILIITVAPAISGIISKLKNNIRMRKGQSIFQPYYNLAKLFCKDEVVSITASWIFMVAPFVVFSSTLTAAMLMLVFIFSPTCQFGVFLAFIFILSLGRFFMALSALDTGSAFGGMGASREMFISSLVEPVLCLVVFALFLQSASVNAAASSQPFLVSSVVSAAALFLVIIAETSRIPVDNQETHLELTMVHEAMVLEYSGRSLAFIEIASYIKQMILFLLIAQIIFPVSAPVSIGLAQLVFWFLWYLARIVIVIIMVVLTEVSLAKMRLFRVVDFLSFGFMLGVVAVVCAILGV